MMANKGGSKLWVEVVCHECAITGPGRFVRGNHIPVREMTREAIRDGWRQRTSGEYECKKCTREGIARLRALTGEQP